MAEVALLTVLCLQFWMCEHTNIIPPVKETKSFPRFVKWDLLMLAGRLSKIDLDNLADHVVGAFFFLVVSSTDVML